MKGILMTQNKMLEKRVRIYLTRSVLGNLIFNSQDTIIYIPQQSEVKLLIMIKLLLWRITIITHKKLFLEG